LERLILTIKTDRMQSVWKEYSKVKADFDIIINRQIVNKVTKKNTIMAVDDDDVSK